MDLNGRRESDNIEDVRGQSGGGPVGRGGGFNIPGGIPLGGFSFRTIIIFAVIYFVLKLFFGVDLLQILSGEPGGRWDRATASPSRAATARLRTMT